MPQLTHPAEIAQSFPVKSAQRVIDLLELFAERKAAATLTALASSLAMPKSSCLALVKTLESGGYLYAVRPNGGFYPTKRWLDKATVICANDPLVKTLRPVMEALRDRTRETLVLAKLAGTGVVYLDVVESNETVRYSAVAGQFKPLHGTASGKALLSGLPAEHRRQLISRLKLERSSPATITDRKKLERDIAHGLARGWQVSRGEHTPDATSIAVPIHIGGDVVAIAVAGLTSRMKKRVDSIGAQLAAARADFQNKQTEE